MKVLTPEEFAFFSKLRELRKELAAKDGVPPFVVFTDEQLSSINLVISTLLAKSRSKF